MRTSYRGVKNGDLLSQQAQTWLPTRDKQAGVQIVNFLEQAAGLGLDPIAALRDGLRLWFGENTKAALPASRQVAAPAGSSGITMEPLTSHRRPTLWPQRPKRIIGELFSSWIWRTSVAAGTPPDIFVQDIPALQLIDIDRDVAPVTLQWLAHRSGQSVSHLAAGTIAPRLDAADDTPAGIIESVLLRDGRFLRLRDGSGYYNRRLNLLQYCPKCLATDEQPYFRRAWRFGTSVVCLSHGCRLLDGCWSCGKPVELMAQLSAHRQPRCAECEAVLSEIGGVRASECKQPQQLLNKLLLYLGTYVPADERRPYLDALRQHLRTVPNGLVSVRATYLAELKPANVDLWFSNPDRPEHGDPIRMLARGLSVEDFAGAMLNRGHLHRNPPVGSSAAEEPGSESPSVTQPRPAF